MRLGKTLPIACVAWLTLAPTKTLADPVADFYRGKTINVLIGVGVGGEYDMRARLVARHIRKHIPGDPVVVPQNMTGAGGLKMANYLSSIAPRDGTYFAIVPNTFPTMQAVGMPGIQFDAAAFRWIGSMTPVVETMATWKTTGVFNIEDARRKEVIAGASGRGAMTYSFPAMLNEIAGTKFKIVLGYSGGNDINLAMERGEVGGRNSTWSNWKNNKTEWVKNRDIAILAYAGPAPNDLPSVPSVKELAKSDDDRSLAQLLAGASAEVGHPFAAPPDVPADRVGALRAAFKATMSDPEFLAEAENLSIEIDAVNGEEIERIVRAVLASPPQVKARAKRILE
jgi:tripartite-type tricarboxylate transporter receptor subunit TctC